MLLVQPPITLPLGLTNIVAIINVQPWSNSMGGSRVTLVRHQLHKTRT